MWTKWLPWRMVISKLAKSHGFIDPVSVLSHLHRLAQPSEVTEPIELLRAGMVLHARGLINSGTIQHNLDWVWPYWVERQFDPRDVSFVPRAFSITHVNLTHRNWTAVGIPDSDYLPIVDPRGLVTPLLDGWSLDAWLVFDDGRRLYPSREKNALQQLRSDGALSISTSVGDDQRVLQSSVDVVQRDDHSACRIRYQANTTQRGWLAVALRPVNPEGVSFIHEVHAEDPARWTVDGEAQIHFHQPPEKIAMSCYRDGDVAQSLDGPQPLDASQQSTIQCNVGLVTAVAMYRLTDTATRQVSVEIPLTHHASWAERLKRVTRRVARHAPPPKPSNWEQALDGACQIQTPNQKWNELFRAATCSMVLHSPGEVFPGPYTYKRFWFRDAAFILHGLLAVNLTIAWGAPSSGFPSAKHSPVTFTRRQVNGIRMARPSGSSIAIVER